MKKIITLGLFLSFAMTQFAQKLDYDNDSKWFFGLNTGAAWNTTDVKNKTHIGWGFILGRSFNYNYGKKVSFDVRMRYLHGKWYGQDYDTTSTLGYNSEFNSGNVLQHYDTLGFTINNFQTDVHELGVELALHLNSLRETKGWDPYIFGGANIVWNQTYGDLNTYDSINNSGGPSAYNYAPGGMTKPEWNLLSDDVYDNALDGSNQNSYNVDFMPSLGIGLGYQVGPRFSVGVEHKTTFALKDVFDGYVNPDKRWGIFENDIYHYTSAYVKFNFRNRHRETHTESTTVTEENGEDLPMGSGDCDEPRIKVSKPRSSSITVDSKEYKIVARFDHIAGRDNIQFTLNSNASTNFAYNAANGNFEAPIFLEPGMNTIILSAGNACGRDEETININYIPCVVPVVNMINPLGGSINVEEGSYTINATVSGATSIKYLIDGIRSSAFSFNSTTGAFSSSLNLKNGANIIRIIGESDCGNDAETVNINYSECAKPAVSIIGNNVINVDQPTFNLNGTVVNVESKNNISFTVNGVNKTFIYYSNSNNVQSVVSLKVGSNTIVLTATNECGNDSEVITIVYTPCVEPQIQMIVPTQSSIITEAGTQQIQAQLLNVSNSNQISLTVNGAVQSVGSFNANSHVYNKTVTLNAGTNTIRLSVDNGCGVASKTFIVTFRPCIAPVITMIAPSTSNSATTNGTMLVKSMITNVNSTNDIMLKVNGQILTGGSYNASTSMFERAVSLSEGNNTIQITANGDCDTDTETLSVNFSDCADPIVSMILPTAVNSNVETNTAIIKAMVSDISSASQLELKVNGIIVNGGSFNAGTGIFQKTVSLNAGANVVSITGTNDCGMICETITINYTPCVNPVVTMISPIAGTTNTSVANIQASILNIAGINEVQLMVNGAIILGGAYNSTTLMFTKTIELIEGQNIIQLTATTSCGTDVQTTNLIFNPPCEEPVVTMVAPLGTSSSVLNQPFDLQATIVNINNAADVQVTLNGIIQSAGTYNNATGLFSKTLNLLEGLNEIEVKATTECGINSKVFSITYEPCLEPVVTMISPLNGSTTPNTNQLISATITNVTSVNQIQLKVNGVVISGGTYNGSTQTFEKTMFLSKGTNEIIITATNECGADTENATVNFVPCLTPVVTMVVPSALTLDVLSQTFDLQATILNISNNSDVQVKLNGIVQVAGSFNNVTNIFEKSLSLAEGSNIIEVKATTDCGTDSEVLTITYNPCLEPSILLEAPTTVSTSTGVATYLIQATLMNVSSLNQVTLSQNGIIVNGCALNGSALSKNVNLTKGLNKFEISVVTDCGKATIAFEINYVPCVEPMITIEKPEKEGSTVSTEMITIQAKISGINSANDVKLDINGVEMPAGNYNSQTLIYVNTASLVEGSNVITITVTNECGVYTESKTIHYKPCIAPTVSVISPNNNDSLPNNTVLFKANVQNAQSVSQIKLFVNGSIIGGATFNTATGEYEKLITLGQGENDVKITVTNACGKDSENIKLFYGQCQKPIVWILATGTAHTTNTMLARAQIHNITSASQVKFYLNGSLITGGTYNSNSLYYEKSVTLNAGSNTLKFEATNDCGKTIESGTAVYAPCTLPTVSMADPLSDITTSNSSYLVKATVNGVTSGSQLQMTVNGIPVSGATYFIITKTYQKNVQLVDGENIIQIIATTNCGVVSEQIKITKGTKSIEQKITICHKQNGKSTTMQIPISEWPKYQAKGAKLGACKAAPIKNQGKPKVETEGKNDTPKEKGKATPEVEKTKETGLKEVEIKTDSTNKKKTKGGK